MIAETLKAVLNEKQNKLVLHLVQLKEDKKRANAGFNEQIKACQKKIETIAETVFSGDETLLIKAFNDLEIEQFKKRK